jgi:hypothetical protein
LPRTAVLNGAVGGILENNLAFLCPLGDSRERGRNPAAAQGNRVFLPKMNALRQSPPFFTRPYLVSRINRQKFSWSERARAVLRASMVPRRRHPCLCGELSFNDVEQLSLSERLMKDRIRTKAGSHSQQILVPDATTAGNCNDRRVGTGVL